MGISRLRGAAVAARKGLAKKFMASWAGTSDASGSGR
jgi:hypothetical protein